VSLRWLRWSLFAAGVVLVLGVCVLAELQEAVVHNQAQPTQAYTPNEQSGNSAANLSGPKRSNEGDQKGHWYDRLTDWLLVLFNGILAIFTVRLFYNAAEQSRDTKASIAIAKIAADAATLSAQASIGVQLPRLAARSMRLYEPSQPYSSYQPFGTLIVSGDPREWSQVSVQICNIGKTNAFVTEECIGYFVGPRLPKTPQYTLVLPSPVDRVIEADGSMDLQIINYFIRLTAEQRRAMKTIELSYRLWVYGFIRYTDFLDKPHEYRFCRRCTWTGGIGGSIGFVTESDFPAEYTRSY
jgi:hypothetical protein